jgi:hypothetical protein
VIAYPLILHERAIQAAEISVQEMSVRLADDLRVLLGHDSVQDLDSVMRMPADGSDRTEIELAAVLAALNDDFRHA